MDDPSGGQVKPAGAPLGSASLLLEYLGIDEPREIAIEAIAQVCGATVVYDRLEGCEARLIGYQGRAVITVDQSAPRARQRFSAAHELGHWVHDRGKVAFACVEGQFVGEWGQANPERRANRFAADLLLPRKLFKKESRLKPMSFATVRKLARDFDTSLTATTIRLIELGSYPAFAVCYDRTGKKRWSARGSLVPLPLKPRECILLRETQAERLFGGARPSGPVETRGDRFLDHPQAHAYTVLEDSLAISPELMLSILWFHDERPIEAALQEMDRGFPSLPS